MYRIAAKRTTTPRPTRTDPSEDDDEDDEEPLRTR